MKNVLGGLLDTMSGKALFRGYSFPVVVSLLLHGSLVLLLTIHWSADQTLNIVPPRNIKASLVELPRQAPPPQAKPKPRVDEAAKKREAERKRQEAQKRKQAEEKRQREIALRKEKEAKEKAKQEEMRRERERQRRLEEERKRQQEEERLRQQREETLRRLEQERQAREQQLAAQQAAEQEEQDASEVAYYSELLNNLIVNHWSRPPSARNNMTVLLQVSLSSFGDLREVKLLQSSGNEAFDDSAIRAVQQAAPFPELRKLDSRIFDANFRRFNFRFRPEDLVR